MQKTTESAGAQAVDACWSRIGVRGDRSCPELKVHIHCRNCPVYFTAARALLDTATSAEALQLATRHFAQAIAPAQQEGAAEAMLSVFVFRLREEWFALPTVLCLEVAELRPIHSLPHRRNGAVLGVANIRGELLVCLSLADILGIGPQAQSRQTRRGAVVPRLLVVKSAAGPVVFPVDEVQGAQRLQDRDLKQPPATVAKAQTRYTKALLTLDKGTVGLLDDQLLFHTVERSLA